MSRYNVVLVCGFLCLMTGSLRAELVTGGVATIALYDTPSNASFADRFFVGDEAAALTRSALLDTGGNPAEAFDRFPGGVVMGINSGSLVQPSGRSRQATTLDFDSQASDLTSFLASWAAATPGFGAFGPSLVGGEKVGIDGVLRFNSPLGVAVIGDLALQYDSTSTFGEGLTLTQNVDANAVLWQLDIDDSTFVMDENGFSFEADMQTASIPAGFYGLDSNAGRFSINAITAIPEPSSLFALVGVSVVTLIRRRRRMSNRFATRRRAK
ncbi:PEP-CTERM sorting domain-containing protein [Rhodopirellula sp. MGV]|uniref:PEP-CTERM sorting domain-containing protein n=1 Tax=Rhodopirellula sp. MGV TaxID=2023130 RepID=UPI000B95EE40|nr:PEP-CTERM sorting domain-containing protein [Rhodopirellula sp. MGV]OYP36088.1 hypothetical protein CGZ80_10105 [Rhodopirellula sp. MGV]PNY36554.1 PEP-CTERM sorting domain-containing protein [Rhodopirellula baltica]